MTYKQQVEAAAAALKRGDDANWELARLTDENTKAGRGPGVESGRVDMATWCGDVAQRSGRAFGERTGKFYRRVWREFGHLRSQTSWSEAYWEVRGGSAKDQFEKGGQRAIKNASAEVKRETFKALAEDAAIVDAVDRETGEIVATMIRKNPVVASHAMTALDERHAEASTKPTLTTDDLPGDNGQTAREAQAELTNFMVVFRRAQRAIQDLRREAVGVTLDPTDRDSFFDALQHLRADLDAVGALLSGSSLDEALADILGVES